jgi:hypothetical protein
MLRWCYADDRRLDMGGDTETKMLKWVAVTVGLLLVFGLVAQDNDRTTAMAPDAPSVVLGTAYVGQ